MLFTEGTIYEYVNFDDFNPELFPKVRNLIRSNDPNHPWLALSDIQLLKKAGLWKRDFHSGREGYTLAAVLIFGKDEIIQQILPHYKIDAIVRRTNIQRYDDRIYIRTNLIDAYDMLMKFVEQHLPDKFYTDNDQRISLRTIIFREIIANLIVHREYANAYPTTFVIGKDSVTTENANNPNGDGILDLDNFSPFPKNPCIAKFFIQIGKVDELGSGIINVNKYLKAYSGKGKPEFVEGVIFKMSIPIHPSIYENDNLPSLALNIETLINDSIYAVGSVVKERLVTLVQIIYSNPGIKIADLSVQLDVSERTIKTDINKLEPYVKYRGSKKVGGYFVSLNLRKKIDLINTQKPAR